MITFSTDPDKMKQAAQRLSHDGIWVKRHFWTDADGYEVPEDHPDAANRDHIYEVDYDRIVALVVEHLTHAAANADSSAPDWVSDPNLTTAERLARFTALTPEPTRGPETTP